MPFGFNIAPTPTGPQYTDGTPMPSGYDFANMPDPGIIPSRFATHLGTVQNGGGFNPQAARDITGSGIVQSGGRGQREQAQNRNPNANARNARQSETDNTSCSMADKHMGLSFGLELSSSDILKRKYRWKFKIQGVSGMINALPHKKGARPSLSFKEQEFQHLNESVWYPMKPEWKPIPLHLYDLKCNKNPVFDWIAKNSNSVGAAANGTSPSGLYDPENGTWRPVLECNIKRIGTLIMLDGCHNAIETWIFENCYPQSVDWGDLDMFQSEVVGVDVTIRYDRAYIQAGQSDTVVAAGPADSATTDTQTRPGELNPLYIPTMQN